jgi:undecaprenyl-diphosphatase
MSILQSLVLGLLQGVTEFLPVSSSGHLVLVPWLLNWPNPGLTYDVVVHLGTLLAVLLYLREDVVTLTRAWWMSVRQLKVDTTEARIAWLVILSMVPGALLGVPFGDLFERLFDSPRVVSIFLLVTGLLLVTSEKLGCRVRTLQEVNWKDALAIGLAQAAAITPGLSRSGATIAAGLVRSLRREDAARFSFLMAIPIIAGASLAQISRSVQGAAASSQPLHWVLGFVAAFLSGYVAIRFLLRYVQANNLRPFAYYCWVMGLIAFVLTFVH